MILDYKNKSYIENKTQFTNKIKNQKGNSIFSSSKPLVSSQLSKFCNNLNPNEKNKTFLKEDDEILSKINKNRIFYDDFNDKSLKNINTTSGNSTLKSKLDILKLKLMNNQSKI